MEQENIKFLSIEEAVKSPAEVTALMLKDGVPEDVRHMKRLNYLLIKGKKIKELPEWLPELTQLKTIKMESHNEKLISPAAFNILEKLPNLEELAFDSGDLSAEISLLKGLRVLSAPGQNNIPKELFELTQLVSLNLSNSWLSEIPEAIVNLTHLENLELADSLISEFSPVLTQLSNLKRLNLSRNNSLKFPDDLGVMPALEELILNDVQFQAFPKAILSMPKLQKLSMINSYGIKTLPEELSKLTQLRELRLVHTGLEGFPKVIQSLTGLSLLHLEGERFDEEELDLSSLQNLKELTLEFCHLKTFPKGITEMKELEYLNLETNEIEELPADYEKLRKIKQLIISRNPFKNPQLLEKNTASDDEKVCISNEEAPDVAGNIVHQIIAEGLQGREQDKYQNRLFVFAVYDIDEGFRIVSQSDSVFKLLLEEASELGFTAEGDIKEAEDYENLPEIIKEKASEEIMSFLCYVQRDFEFFTDKEDYESDFYLQDLADVFPEASFLFGWSSFGGFLEEAYAVLELDIQEE